MQIDELYSEEPKIRDQVYRDIETIQQMLEDWRRGGDVDIEEACYAGMSLVSIASRRYLKNLEHCDLSE